MKREIIKPNIKNFIKSLRDIGYTFEIAVADVIDNSIAANAKSIKLYSDFINDKPAFMILDDGFGMNEVELTEAMRFASKDPDDERETSDLGRFGLGLKTASFSQAKRLTVFSKKNGDISIAQWDLAYLEQQNEWILNYIDLNVYELTLLEELKQQESGTLVVWEEIDRFNDSVAYNDALMKTSDHISLVFHRFIDGENNKVNKIKFTFNDRLLPAFNPFNESNFATQQKRSEDLTINGKIFSVQPFILPHYTKTNRQEYEKFQMNEGYLKSQGFYLYRANRLIIYGTWWGIVRTKSEYQLVRIKIDIDNNQDADWGIDVKKSTASPSKEIKNNLKRVVNELTNLGQRTFAARGSRIKSSEYIPFWEVKKTHEKTSFVINMENPLFSRLNEELSPENRKILKLYLDSIQEYLPVDQIYHLVQENPHQIEQEKVNADEMIATVKQLIVNGVNQETIKAFISTQGFQKNPDLLKLLED